MLHVEDELQLPAGVSFWTYEGRMGQVMAIRAVGNNVVFMLLDPERDLISQMGPGSYPARNFTLLPRDGTYLLALQTESLEGSLYTLDAVASEPAELELNTLTHDTIDAGQYRTQNYRLYAHEGDLLRIEIARRRLMLMGIWPFSTARAMVSNPLIAPTRRPTKSCSNPGLCPPKDSTI